MPPVSNIAGSGFGGMNAGHAVVVNSHLYMPDFADIEARSEAFGTKLIPGAMTAAGHLRVYGWGAAPIAPCGQTGQAKQEAHSSPPPRTPHGGYRKRPA